jgi:hypothetical protein
MTYDMISFENILIGSLCAVVVAFFAALSQMKQPELRPIPIRVRPEDARAHRRNR